MGKLIRTLAVGTVLATVPGLASALVSVGAEFNYWDSSLSGNVKSGGDSANVDRDLNLSTDSTFNFTAFFEHPIPALPNVRVNYTSINQSGNGTVSNGFGGVVGVERPVRSEMELDQLDLTAYYSPLNNWVKLDLGLTLRNLDGEVDVRDRLIPANSERVTVRGTLPMLYGAARVSIPTTDLAVGGEINYISFDGDSISDYNLYAQYDVLGLVRLRAGYRELSVDFEDGNDKLDLTLKGPFFSAGIRF